MKPENIVRKAIQAAYCMDYDVYCKVLNIKETDYSFHKWRFMQKSFGSWFCDLDSGNAKMFMDWLLGDRKVLVDGFYWPEARDWMWHYCVHLGPFVHEGRSYDLGVYHQEGMSSSAAIVFGPEDGDYMSGFLYPSENPIYIETQKRWEAYKK